MRAYGNASCAEELRPIHIFTVIFQFGGDYEHTVLVLSWSPSTISTFGSSQRHCERQWQFKVFILERGLLIAGIDG